MTPMKKYNASLYWIIELAEYDEYKEPTGEWVRFHSIDNPTGLYFNQRECYKDFDTLKSFSTQASCRMVQVASAILEYA